MAKGTSRLSKNQKIGLMCAGLFVVMVGAAYASVPLYRLFCQVTGFNGTTQKAVKASNVVLDKVIRVRFDTNVNNVEFQFKPEQPYQDVQVGKTAMAYFKVKNLSDHPIRAQASYNVLPEAMGGYFMKLECFCFTEQTFKAGEEKEFPMVYYLDPEMIGDIDAKGTTDVTLSYTFFPVKEAGN
jgi:cytochrome c oxidase assembly protein subunit 11